MNRKTAQIIILGDGAVGKTAILKRFHFDTFVEDHMITLGLDFVNRKFTHKDGSQCTIKLWDTAGQDRFRTLTYSFYKKADGVILAFDLTEASSFANLKNWMESINQHANAGIPMVIVGNKKDLADDRKITFKEGSDYASNFGLRYFETSAKTNEGIEEFMHVIMEMTVDAKFTENNPALNRQSHMLNPKQHRQSKPEEKPQER